MKLRFVSVLGALALTATAAAAPAAAAGPSAAPDQPATASVLTPAQLGTSDPAQWGGWGYPWPGGMGMGVSGLGGMGMGFNQSMSSDSSTSSSDSFTSSDDDDGHVRGHHGRGGLGMQGLPTGSPWPWWAGMPLSQISAATGGAWPWAFGSPLFLPPPVPPVPPLGVSLFNIGLAQQSGLLNGRTCTPTVAFTICR